MGDEWYTDPGASGTITVEWRDDGWYLATSESNGEIRCKLPDQTAPPDSAGTVEFDVTVSKFTHAAGSGPSYLFAERAGDGESTAETAEREHDSAGESPATKPDRSRDQPTATSRSSDRTMLDKIAREKIGDEEFTMSEENEDSVIGEAKKRARKQGRDPAIDPKLKSGKEEE